MIRKTILSIFLGLSLIGPHLCAEEILIVSKQAPPDIYKEDGKLKGLFYEIADRVATDAGYPFKVELYPWARVYQMGLNDPNVLIPTLFRTEKREKLFKWIGEVMSLEYCFYKLTSRKDININSLSDAKKYKIGVMNKEVVHQYLTENGFTQQLETVPEGDLNIKKLVAGRIDLVPFESTVFKHKLEQLGYKLSSFEKVYLIKPLSKRISMAFSKNTDDTIVEKYKDAFHQIKKNGSYDEIIRKWER